MPAKARPATGPQHQVRTTADIRNMLFDEIDLLRAGKIDCSRLAVIGRACHQIIASARLEIEFTRLRAELLNAPQNIEVVRLSGRRE